MTISQAFQMAVQRHQAGRLGEAEALYRQILAAQPDHAEALHHLGLIAREVGRHDLAVEWILQATALDPNNAVAQSNLGEAYRTAGRFDEAAAACRRALAIQPSYPNAHYNLGVALRDGGQLHEAEDAFRRALDLKPEFPEAYNNLGVALAGQGRQREAIAAYRRALELRPNYPEAHNNLGAALAGEGRHEEAMAAYRQALELKAAYPEAHYNMGNALRETGQLDEALTAYRRALAIKPGYPAAHSNLGNALRERGQLDEAVAAYRRAVELKPDFAEAHLNLGDALRKRGQLEEAVAACRRALEFKPDSAKAHNSLGKALKDQGNLDGALAAFHLAAELAPEAPETYNNLGNALKDQGEFEGALAAFRRALEIKPEHAGYHSNLIYTLHLQQGGGEALRREWERWNRQFGKPVNSFVRPQASHPAVARRLRVGYVSPDFCDHPVGRHALPLFECHDRGEIEVLCYSGVARPDWMTERFRALAGVWRNTSGVPDARLAEMIREDGVDILVDLALHTAGNRLPVFARRPAPVQVSWLGYPGGTGLDSMGYRLTDAYMDPPGEEAAWSAEEPVRLPDCWCCYQPVGEYPEISALPALSAGVVTFGSLNNFAKVNEGVLALWTRVLDAVKGSRLLMLCPQGRTRERVLAFFAARGIARERVEMAGFAPRLEYLKLYQRIDLGLDPFPGNGMSTTCDALWMGAPVLTLPGKTPVSRAGLSLLSSIGLGELAASSEDDYVRLAVELAGDLPRLADLRAAMRGRMKASPLLDAERFARSVETAYGFIWERWRASSG